jgi:hypothetical protein
MMNRTISKVYAIFGFFLQFASIAYAQIDVSTDELDFLPGEDKEVDIFVTDILNWIIGAATLVCIVMLVYSGYMYMTAGGDEEKVRTAQKTITGSLIGLVVSLLSLVLVNFVLETFLGKPPVG